MQMRLNAKRWRWRDLIDRGVLGSIGGGVRGVSWELQRQSAVSYWTWSPSSEEQIENLFLSPSIHSGGAIKRDNCCLALSSRRAFFSPPATLSFLFFAFFSPNTNASGPSITAKIHGRKPDIARGNGFHWNVWCSNHHSLAEPGGYEESSGLQNHSFFYLYRT